MNLKQKRLLGQLSGAIYRAAIPEPTKGTIEITDGDVLLDINGGFRGLNIFYVGKFYINNRLPNGYGIKLTKGVISITNLLGKNLPNDNILFAFSGDLKILKAELTTFSGKKIRLANINNNLLELVQYSKTNVEDSTLLFLEEEDNLDVLNGSSYTISGIDDDSIKGLYTTTPFADGYTGYYNFHPTEKVYMTGERLTNQSVPIGTTKHKFNSPSYKKALKKIYSKVVRNENIIRKTKGVSLDKQVEKVKPKTMKPLIKKQRITKGGKY